MEYVFVIVSMILLFIFGVAFGEAIGEERFKSKSYDDDIRKEFVTRLENQYGYVTFQGTAKAILQNDIYDCLEEYE